MVCYCLCCFSLLFLLYFGSLTRHIDICPRFNVCRFPAVVVLNALLKTQQYIGTYTHTQISGINKNSTYFNEPKKKNTKEKNWWNEIMRTQNIERVSTDLHTNAISCTWLVFSLVIINSIELYLCVLYTVIFCYVHVFFRRVQVFLCYCFGPPFRIWWW